MKYKFSLKNGFGSILRNPIAVSLFFSFVAVGLVVLIAGVNPISAYVEIWRGATTGSGPKTVINRIKWRSKFDQVIPNENFALVRDN